MRQMGGYGGRESQGAGHEVAELLNREVVVLDKVADEAGEGGQDSPSRPRETSIHAAITPFPAGARHAKQSPVPKAALAQVQGARLPSSSA